MRRLLLFVAVSLVLGSVSDLARSSPHSLAGLKPCPTAVRDAGQQNPPPPPTPQRPAQAAQPARDRVRPTTGTAVIRGRVFASDSGAPLRRARVTWSSDVPATGGVSSQGPPGVMTDANGRYEIRDLPAGRYRVFARRTGYVQMDFGARRPGSYGRTLPSDSERGITIELADGQAFAGADFHLARAGVITGHILDEYGDPLISAFVGASRMDTVGGRRRSVPFAADNTDDQGEYRLSGLPPGTYYVVVSPPQQVRLSGQSSTYADVFYPGVPVRDQARPITVRAGQEVTEITFTLLPVRLARVSGSVVTSQGTVPKSASFTLARSTQIGVSQTIVYGGPAMGAGGTFALPGVAPGEYDLVVNAQTEAGTSELGTARFSVTGDDISGVMIVTGAEGRLSGTVKTDSGAALPPATAAGSAARLRVTATAVEDGSDGVLSSAAVNSDGTFVAPVRPGPRLIGLSGLPSGWGVAVVFSGERNITDLPVDVRPGVDFPAQIIVSNRLPEIAGSVIDQEGKPTWDFTVVVFPRDSSRWVPGSQLTRGERPNQRGEFRVDRLRPGDYYIVAVQGGDEVDWSEPEALERLRSASAEITLALGEKKTVQLKVGRPGT